MKISNQVECEEPGFQVNGNLVYSTDIRGSTGNEKIKHFRSFQVVRKGEQWKIRTANLKEDQFFNATDYDEMGCDGTRIFDLKSFDENHPNISKREGRITAQGRVRQDEVPHGLDDGFIYPLWLAYCSSNYFLNQNDNRVAAPLFMTEDSLQGAVSPVFKLPAEWRLNDSNFVSEIAWQSEGKALVSENGACRLIALLPPFDSGYLMASFKTTDWIKLCRLTMPAVFAMKAFFPNWKTKNCEISYIIEGRVKTIHPLQEFSFLPELTKKTLITDTRYRLSGGCGHLSYGSLSWMNEQEIEAKCKSLGIQYEKQTTQN